MGAKRLPAMSRPTKPRLKQSFPACVPSTVPVSPLAKATSSQLCHPPAHSGQGPSGARMAGIGTRALEGLFSPTPKTPNAGDATGTWRNSRTTLRVYTSMNKRRLRRFLNLKSASVHFNPGRPGLPSVPKKKFSLPVWTVAGSRLFRSCLPPGGAV